jgi:hypothetical protein
MAISPEQARLGAQWHMTPDEEARLGSVEGELDEAIAREMEGKSADGVRLGLEVAQATLPLGTLTPAMRAALTARYHAAGWSSVRVTEHRNNYSFQFNV